MVTQTKAPEKKPALLRDEDPMHRSIGIGIACTLLFHILLFWLSPQFGLNKFSGSHGGIKVKTNAGKTFDFQLEPPPEPPQNPFKYVETNPDAPENTPDKTANISNRNQQSAQAQPAKEIDPENRPSIKGQDKIKNDTAIVTGNMTKPQAGASAAPEAVKNDSKQTQEEEKARAAQTPMAGHDKLEDLTKEGIATNVSDSKTDNNQAEHLVEGSADSKEANGGLISVAKTSKQQPKPRPHLTQAMPSILTNRPGGTSNAGFLGIDARWSEYGDYLHRMEEAIVSQWYALNMATSVYPPHGSTVNITFKLDSNGDVTITTVENVDCDKQGIWRCQSAIQDRSPYGKWTDAMISVLGTEQQLTYGFLYQ